MELDLLQVAALILGPTGAAYVGVRTSLDGVRESVREIKEDVKEINRMVTSNASRIAALEVRATRERK